MLIDHLTNAGHVTGTRPDTNTSNSAMGVIKNFLIGAKQFDGDEKFLIFGRVLHEHLQFIENVNYVSPDFKLLDATEQKWIYGCLDAVRKNSICKSLLKNSERERKYYVNIEGVKISLLLDVEQTKLKIGTDWKTTSCTSEQDFIAKAITYDYVRQGLLYMWARQLKHFYFIGIQKQPPHQIYIMDVSRYKEELHYASEELKFLTYFFKHYGKVILKGKEQSPKVLPPTTQTNTTMTGKEALQQLKEQHKAAKTAKTIYHKEVKLFNKMVAKFPKKELEVYQEKLQKFVQL